MDPERRKFVELIKKISRKNPFLLSHDWIQLPTIVLRHFQLTL